MSFFIYTAIILMAYFIFRTKPAPAKKESRKAEKITKQDIEEARYEEIE